MDNLMTTKYVGIDVSKKQLDVALLQGNNAQHRTFRNTPTGWDELVQWLGEDPTNLQVCLEATRRYSEGITTYLFQLYYPISVVKPAHIPAYGLSRLRRQKTDKADALLIAQFCPTQQPPLWSPADPALQQLKVIVRHRKQLQQML